MRAFIGIELPENLKKELGQLAKSFPKGWNIKLVEEENFHLTLLFLGSISEEEKEKIVGVLGELGLLGKIRLKTDKLEFFPSSSERRGLWLSVSGKKEKLFSLYKRVIDRLLTAGIKLKDNRLKFSPHIALGRFRSKPSFTEFKEFVRDFSVNKITLFQSKLSNKGPVYIKIAEFEVK